ELYPPEVPAPRHRVNPTRAPHGHGAGLGIQTGSRPRAGDAQDKIEPVKRVRYTHDTYLKNGKGRTHEQRTGSGWNEERRLYLHLRRQARKVENRRPPLWRVGDLPHEGIFGRSQPDLRFAVQRMVWTDHPAIQRRRKDLGNSRRRSRKDAG